MRTSENILGSLKISTIVLIIFTFTVSCTNFPPLTKDRYIKNFVAFINEVGLNHEKYTDEEWKKADEKFEKYADTYFEKYKEKMNSEEISKVNALKGNYIGYKINGKSGAMIKEIMLPLKILLRRRVV